MPLKSSEKQKKRGTSIDKSNCTPYTFPTFLWASAAEPKSYLKKKNKYKRTNLLHRDLLLF